jgi:putative spermidine/putrescine transport system substrate-binding protein
MRNGKPGRRDVLKAMGGSITATALAGCSGGGEDGDGGGSDGGSSPTPTEGGGEPAKPEKIVVRAWGGSWQESLKEHISDPFTEETGVAVEHTTTEDIVVQNKIQQSVKQDRAPPVNVQWSTTNLSFRAFKRGLMASLNPDIVSNLDGLFEQAKPDTGEESDVEWPFASLYSYTEPLTWNTDLVDSAPDSWEAWWDDEWEDSLGIYGRGTGTLPIVATLTGTEITEDSDFSAVWEKYRDLEPNIGLVGDDTNLTQGVREGDLSMVCMVVANTVNIQREDAPVEYKIPDPGAAMNRDAMYTPKGQSESELYWSQKYINKAAGTAQGEWAEQLGVTPLNENVSVPDYMKDNPAFPTTEKDFEKLILVPPRIEVARASEWEQKFKEIFGT